MKTQSATLTLLIAAALAAPAHAQFLGFTNQGLVALGRVPADTFDARGSGLDTLGGFGSAAVFDPASWSQDGATIRGTLYGLPDRGFGDGTQNYIPRVEVFAIEVTPYYGN